MKNKWTIIIYIIVFISLVSCKKIMDILDIGMSATIDGNEWVSATRVTVLDNNMFTITGTSISGDILAITIKGSTTGTYTLNPLLLKTQCGCTYKGSLSSASDDWYLSTLGSVELTKVDQSAKTISGTFNFTLLKGDVTIMTVTNGEFKNLSYK